MESDFGSIPFTDNPAAPGRGPAPPPPSSSASSSQPVEVSGGKLTVKEFITFDQPLKIDRLSKKLEKFNTKQPDESAFAPQLKQTVATVAAEAWAEAMADAEAEEGAEASSSEGTKESPKLKFLDYNHEIKSGEKYFYSIIVDETADLGKSEQLSLSISYLNNGVKKERFLSDYLQGLTYVPPETIYIQLTINTLESLRSEDEF